MNHRYHHMTAVIQCYLMKDGVTLTMPNPSLDFMPLNGKLNEGISE